MPKSPSPEPAVERFNVGAGRYGITLLVSSVGRKQVKASVRLMNAEYGYDADDPGTDEITLESEPMQSRGELATWLQENVFPKAVREGLVHRLPVSSILEVQSGIVRIVQQFLGRRDRAADVNK